MGGVNEGVGRSEGQKRVRAKRRVHSAQCIGQGAEGKILFSNEDITQERKICTTFSIISAMISPFTNRAMLHLPLV